MYRISAWTLDNPHQVAPPQDLPQITDDDFTCHANAAKSKPTSSGAPHHNSENKLGSEVLIIKHNARVTEVKVIMKMVTRN